MLAYLRKEGGNPGKAGRVVEVGSLRCGEAAADDSNEQAAADCLIGLEGNIPLTSLLGVSSSALSDGDVAIRLRDPPLNNAFTSSHAYSISLVLLKRVHRLLNRWESLGVHLLIVMWR